jgi:hypothetical protein
MLGVLTFHQSREAPIDEYDGRQFVGIDLHRRRSVIVRQVDLVNVYIRQPGSGDDSGQDELGCGARWR